MEREKKHSLLKVNVFFDTLFFNLVKFLNDIEFIKSELEK